ncbi:Uncharacterized protein APZ42_023313 [Daphnia magna]|uniref:Secreted protein n=1 Tax=Daphnia magna TaxID=35525 RepID=A0A164V248_9CRUS|nr:Uncharacterized protein APZ42_023313 [Daphnia magna]
MMDEFHFSILLIFLLYARIAIESKAFKRDLIFFYYIYQSNVFHVCPSSYRRMGSIDSFTSRPSRSYEPRCSKKKI